MQTKINKSHYLYLFIKIKKKDQKKNFSQKKFFQKKSFEKQV